MSAGLTDNLRIQFCLQILKQADVTTAAGQHGQTAAKNNIGNKKEEKVFRQEQAILSRQGYRLRCYVWEGIRPIACLIVSYGGTDEVIRFPAPAANREQ